MQRPERIVGQSLTFRVRRNVSLHGVLRAKRCEKLSQRRRIDDAENRLIVSDKPDVDRKVGFARNERTCSIKGIDQKELAARLRNLARGN